MAKLGNIFNKEEIKKEEQHPRRTIKWIHYSKLKTNPDQYCPARDKEEIESLADLIEAAGEVIENLSVSKSDTDEYRIIAGHKRCEACRLLVEERGLKQFAFLPCIVNNVSAVQESFRVMASNGYHTKKPYELMHEITEMEKLLREHPEEFPPSLQKGRMVERLSKKMGIARATVQEYQQISRNLLPEAMEKFKEGEIEKSAALTLARLPEKMQKAKQVMALVSYFRFLINFLRKHVKKRESKSARKENMVLASSFSHSMRSNVPRRKKCSRSSWKKKVWNSLAGERFR